MGIIRGLALIEAFLRLLFWAIKTKNAQAIEDCVALGEMWLKDATGTAIPAIDAALSQAQEVGKDPIGGIKSTLSFALLFGDPFADTRQPLRDLQSKYGVH